jgi:hypothetical protein
MAWTDALQQAARKPVPAGPIPIGRRNKDLTSIAGAMRRHNASEMAMLAALREENRRCEVPLGDNELARIAHSVSRYAPEPDPPDIKATPTNGSSPVNDKAPAETDIGHLLGRRYAGWLPTDPPAPLLLDRLDPSGHSILFGPGGVGKGTVAAYWTTQLVQDGHRVLIVDYESHPDEWGRRLYGLGLDDASAVSYVAPFGVEWQGKRGSLWEQANDLRSLVEQDAIGYVIVDSAVYACAGKDPIDANVAAAYSSGVQMIGTPVLSLAHVNRSKDMRQPFGSAFWHNGARVTWSMEEDGEGAALLTMRKSNNYRRVAKVRVETTWLDDLPRSVLERPYHVAIADRIRTILERQPLTAPAITAALNESRSEEDKAVEQNYVRTVLSRGSSGPFAPFTKDGERWSLAE